MIAIYVRYQLETGLITQAQAQFKGIAPKVADWPRQSHESVVRFSLPNDAEFSVSSLVGRIEGEAPYRTLRLGSGILVEDIEHSTKATTCVERT